MHVTVLKISKTILVQYRYKLVLLVLVQLKLQTQGVSQD